MTFNKDMSFEAVMRRYSKANVKTIVVADRDVFASLQDVPDLLDEIRALRAFLQTLPPVSKIEAEVEKK